MHSEVAKEKAGHKRRINWRHRLRRGTKRRLEIVARRMRKWRAKRKCAAGLTAVSAREKGRQGEGSMWGEREREWQREGEPEMCVSIKETENRRR